MTHIASALGIAKAVAGLMKIALSLQRQSERLAIRAESREGQAFIDTTQRIKASQEAFLICRNNDALYFTRTIPTTNFPFHSL